MNLPKVSADMKAMVETAFREWLRDQGPSLGRLLEDVATQAAPLLADEFMGQMQSHFEAGSVMGRVEELVAASRTILGRIDFIFSELKDKSQDELIEVRNKLEVEVAFFQGRKPQLWVRNDSTTLPQIPF